MVLNASGLELFLSFYDSQQHFSSVTSIGCLIRFMIAIALLSQEKDLHKHFLPVLFFLLLSMEYTLFLWKKNEKHDLLLKRAMGSCILRNNVLLRFYVLISLRVVYCVLDFIIRHLGWIRSNKVTSPAIFRIHLASKCG